ncbi:MAG TPA: hypothetical protein DDW54_01800 [Clostridiales bacterium]|nr:hypothetical protein [Clostridiales bacterium]
MRTGCSINSSTTKCPGRRRIKVFTSPLKLRPTTI